MLTSWWRPRVESTLVLLEDSASYDQHVLGKTLLAFSLLCFVLQGQACPLHHVSLDFLLLHSSPYDEKDISFDVSSRRSYRSL